MDSTRSWDLLYLPLKHGLLLQVWLNYPTHIAVSTRSVTDLRLPLFPSPGSINRTRRISACASERRAVCDSNEAAMLFTDDRPPSGLPSPIVPIVSSSSSAEGPGFFVEQETESTETPESSFALARFSKVFAEKSPSRRSRSVLLPLRAATCISV